MDDKDYKLIIIMTLMLMAAIVIVLFFEVYQQNYRTCTSNPLVYAAELYEETYQANFSGTAVLRKGNVPLVVFEFDRNGQKKING